MCTLRPPCDKRPRVARCQRINSSFVVLHYAEDVINVALSAQNNRVSVFICQFFLSLTRLSDIVGCADRHLARATFRVPIILLDPSTAMAMLLASTAKREVPIRRIHPCSRSDTLGTPCMKRRFGYPLTARAKSSVFADVGRRRQATRRRQTEPARARHIAPGEDLECAQRKYCPKITGAQRRRRHVSNILGLLEETRRGRRSQSLVVRALSSRCAERPETEFLAFENRNSETSPSVTQ